jgi:hypothetical protein
MSLKMEKHNCEEDSLEDRINGSIMWKRMIRHYQPSCLGVAETRSWRNCKHSKKQARNSCELSPDLTSWRCYCSRRHISAILEVWVLSLQYFCNLSFEKGTKFEMTFFLLRKCAGPLALRNGGGDQD